MSDRAFEILTVQDGGTLLLTLAFVTDLVLLRPTTGVKTR